PTVSMGLGPMMAIFQARFTRYLEHRGLVKPSDQKVWAFLGDGEMDEPESMGALTMPVREGLDNLIFVINCNLQRLDGPVRGKGGEGQMIAHQAKKMSEEDVRAFRDRFNIPVSDEDLGKLPFRKPDAETEEARYLNERRTVLGGFLPTRRRTAPPLVIPPLAAFGALLEGTAEREISTTMAFVRALTVLLKDKNIGRNI